MPHAELLEKDEPGEARSPAPQPPKEQAVTGSYRPTPDLDGSPNRSFNRGKADIQAIRESSERTRSTRSVASAVTQGRIHRDKQSEDRRRTIPQPILVRTYEVMD